MNINETHDLLASFLEERNLLDAFKKQLVLKDYRDNLKGYCASILTSERFLTSEDLIECAFFWSETEEEYDFWKNINLEWKDHLFSVTESC